MDTAVMDGNTLEAGAKAGIQGINNPPPLNHIYKSMPRSPVVLMAS